MKKYALVAVYSFMFLLFLFKMFYYREELGYVLDEEVHISYVAYLEENPGKLIPEFEKMGLCEGGRCSEKDIYKYIMQGRTCYLGHPPLYYKLMQMVGGVITENTEEGHYVYAHLGRLKTANIYLTGFAMVLILYIGFTRLGRFTQSLVWHGVYAAAAVSVPMLALCGSGVTNDNLANLGVAVFMLGVLRYYEKKKGYLTYLLVAIGFFISIMSKLTVGEFLVVMLVVIFIVDMVQNKNLSLISNKYFFITLPIYLLAGAYFIVLLVQYGSIQPGLDIVAPVEQEFIAKTERADMTFFTYIPYFFRQFGYTWTGIYNGRFYGFKLLDIWEGRVFLFLLYAPFVFIVGEGICRLKMPKKEGAFYSVVFMAVTISLIVTITTQLLKGYESFSIRGYMGGCQARYYLCNIPFMALAMAEGLCLISKWNPYGLLEGCRERVIKRQLPKLNKEHCAWGFGIIAKVCGTVIIFWFLYSDFIYFLTTHDGY